MCCVVTMRAWSVAARAAFSFTKSIAYKLSRDFSFSSFPGAQDPNLTALTHHSNPNPNKILSHLLPKTLTRGLWSEKLQFFAYNFAGKRFTLRHVG